jgi:6-phosphogluconolactonase (cycloisomerase 2 family)
VIVPDKGLDRIFVFRFDAQSGRLSPTVQGSALARPGSGPRHAAFHPALPIVWVVDEVSSCVTTYQWDEERGHLKAVQILPSAPPDFTGEIPDRRLRWRGTAGLYTLPTAATTAWRFSPWMRPRAC